MNKKRPFMLLCFVLCLCSFVPLCLYAQETKTERFDFPQGGVLRLNNSDGELTIQGWERPDVEITTIKAKHPYHSDDRRAPVQVYVDNLAGDIRVKVHNGAIHLRLPENNYSIDAKTGTCSVVSDFPGRWHRRLWPLGQRYEESDSAPHKLHLRVGYGDIAILKMVRPPYALTSDSRQGVNP